MRICLVTHGFPPVERTGVENYTHALARALARAGQRVEVFAPRRDPELPEHSLRREEHDGWAVNWVTQNHNPSGPREMLLAPGMAQVFGAFLERERPEVVHFQHLIKVGIELVSEARARGIPSLYTAHDYYPVCHRYTLLRPDLSRCDVRGDSMACARCDLALGLLNRVGTLGDYQMGALPGQLGERERHGLGRLLADEPGEAGFNQEQVDAAFDRRLELDGLRARAFAALDRVLAPTEFMARELARGGIEREKIEVLGYGIENSDLRLLPPIRTDRTAPVRFAFLGGFSKHKGVHVLLEAFQRLGPVAELELWGDSSDAPYVEFLRRGARAAGAGFRGPYERAELPRILARLDALVVPSIWVENQPLVIREAFSARRPVLASRLGALPESVRDSVDGLLFEPGDAEDLARVLRRCVQEPDLLPRLAQGISPVKDVDQHAQELVALYGRLAKSRMPEGSLPELPASLRAFQARQRELATLPARELLRTVLAGLEDLRRSWSEELGRAGPTELLVNALGEGSSAQDRLREARAEIAWLRSKNDELGLGRSSVQRMLSELDLLLQENQLGTRRGAELQRTTEAFLREQQAELERTRGELAEASRYIAEKEGILQRTEAELRAAGEYVRAKEESARLADEQARAAAAVTERAEQRSAEAEERARAAQEAAREAQQAARNAQESMRAAEEATRSAQQAARAAQERAQAAQERAQAAEARMLATREDMGAAAELGLSAVEAQERLLRRVLAPIIERIHRIVSPGTEPELPAEGARFAELLKNLELVLQGLRAVDQELSWRRRAMDRSFEFRVRKTVKRWLGRAGPAPDREEPASGRDGQRERTR